jgi:uncharacterized protein (TIGR02996 family)
MTATRSDIAALLRQALASPSDDESLLVLADALDEVGGRR